MTSLLPPDDDLDELHARTYEVKTYLVDDEILVRGAVLDMKPAGLYVPDDPEPLEMHRMVVEFRVSFPELVVTAAEVMFETHPHSTCPTITEHYGKLVGLPIARGFTHKVRELFGGPRGCTHTTALLQAMAPAVIQSMWSVAARRQVDSGERFDPSTADESRFAANVNTCHVWAEDDEQMVSIRAGSIPEVPLQIERRLRELGRDPDDWNPGLAPE